MGSAWTGLSFKWGGLAHRGPPVVKPLDLSHSANQAMWQLQLMGLAIKFKDLERKSGKFVIQMNLLPLGSSFDLLESIIDANIKVSVPERNQGVKSSRSDAADLIRVQWKRLKIYEPMKQLLVHIRNHIFRQRAEKAFKNIENAIVELKRSFGKILRSTLWLQYMLKIVKIKVISWKMIWTRVQIKRESSQSLLFSSKKATAKSHKNW